MNLSKILIEVLRTPESKKDKLRGERSLNHLIRQHKKSKIREVCFNNKWDNTNWE